MVRSRLLRWCVGGWFVESSSLGWCCRVDGVSASVDDDVVVEPAQGREVVGVGWSAVRPGCDVVCLEAVSADAALNGAHRAVTVQHVSSESGWDGPGSASHAEWCAVFGSPGDFDHAVAQDRFDRVRSDPGPGFDDNTGLAIRACSVTGVDEDGE